MADQRPSRVFPAKFEGGCTGCGGDIVVGDPIRLHHGLAYHDDVTCLPEISAWGEPVRRTYNQAVKPDEPRDPWG